MSTPPNWFPDPDDPSQLRYWDGSVWTEHRAPAVRQGTPAAASANPVKSSETGEKRIPLFGARAQAKESARELESLRAEMDGLGVLDVVQLKQKREELEGAIAELRREFEVEQGVIEAKLTELRQNVVTTEEAQILQEVGIYQYRHPLQDSVAYKDELLRLQAQIKGMVMRNGGAIQATTDWTVNGSKTQGRKMVRDFSKLMLRAYNAEADNLVRGMKPYKLQSAVDRLDKVSATIAKLGSTMAIRVSTPYHALRVKELELTADYQEMLAREKDKERQERQRLRDERKAQQEMERERERLSKERQHYVNALAALRNDADARSRLQTQIDEVDKAIADVDYRAANIRTGNVYVISNVGSFGEGIIKVGLTRRLDPKVRVRELSDASVPFNFDVHALFFSKDAVGIEAEMHRRLADRRVNRVNLRREFFHATPEEALEQLMALPDHLTGDLITFEAGAEAAEYHQSQPKGAPQGSGRHVASEGDDEPPAL